LVRVRDEQANGPPFSTRQGRRLVCVAAHLHKVVAYDLGN